MIRLLAQPLFRASSALFEFYTVYTVFTGFWTIIRGFDNFADFKISILTSNLKSAKNLRSNRSLRVFFEPILKIEVLGFVRVFLVLTN